MCKKIQLLIELNIILNLLAYGLKRNADIEQLKINGMKPTYKNLYSQRMKFRDFINIRENMCNSKSIICVGGGRKDNPKVLDLVACANCYSVLNETELNKPRFINKAWWYFTKEKSFGFSPSENINQKRYDVEDQQDEFRLSWHIDVQFGGGRLGRIAIV